MRENMSKGILSFHKKVKESTLEYIETAFYTKDKEFNKARVELLGSETSSPVFKEPVLEPLKKYVETNTNFEKLMEISDYNNLIIARHIIHIETMRYVCTISSYNSSGFTINNNNI